MTCIECKFIKNNKEKKQKWKLYKLPLPGFFWYSLKPDLKQYIFIVCL